MYPQMTKQWFFCVFFIKDTISVHSTKALAMKIAVFFIFNYLMVKTCYKIISKTNSSLFASQT